MVKYLKETYFSNLAMYVLTMINIFLLQSYRDRSECVLSKPRSNIKQILGENKGGLSHWKHSDFTAGQLQKCLRNKFVLDLKKKNSNNVALSVLYNGTNHT